MQHASRDGDDLQSVTSSRPFNLTRWFSLLSLLTIATTSAVSGLLLSNFLTSRMLDRDAVLTMEFVQSILLAENAEPYFLDPAAKAKGREMKEAFYHFAQLPHVLRTNVYSRDRVIIWSSDRRLVGKRFERNPELDEALSGRLVTHSGTVQKEEHVKGEHPLVRSTSGNFIETYIPIRDAQTNTVIGAVETYRTPDALFEAIRTGEMLIWASAVAGGAFLYAVLFWIVRRADRTIRQQQQRLVKAETFAVVGEMASAVAHGIRNPLSSIRTSAELALDGEPGPFRQPAQEIITEVDRLEKWVRALLSYSRPLPGSFQQKVALNEVLRESLGNFTLDMDKRRITAKIELQKSVPPIEGDPALLEQVINSLLANALEAMPHNGMLTLSSEVSEDGKHVLVTIADAGAGMVTSELEHIFKPFYTTKPKGLGLGLPLAKRIVERLGGTIAIESAPGAGTRVNLRFPAL